MSKLRKPDVLEINPNDGSARGARLTKFINVKLFGTINQVSLIAWHANAGCWAAWYDDTEPNPPHRDALVEAGVTIAD